MLFEERTVGDVAIVRVTGDITLSKSRNGMLHEKVRRLIEQGHRKVLVDLAAVSYVDSAGLGELVQANSTVKNHGGSLRLFSPTSRMRELLMLTRLTTILRVYDDEAQAVESFAAKSA